MNAAESAEGESRRDNWKQECERQKAGRSRPAFLFGEDGATETGTEARLWNRGRGQGLREASCRGIRTKRPGRTE